MDTSKYGFALRLTIWACTLLSWLPDAIVANSNAGRRIHRQLGYRARHFPVIPNGVDTDLFKPDDEARKRIRAELGIADETPVLAMIARMDPMKDHATFLAALENLPGVTAILAGKGTESLPHGPNLHCLGLRDDVEQIYAASDIVVLSSAFGEGFPTSSLKAWHAAWSPWPLRSATARRSWGRSAALRHLTILQLWRMPFATLWQAMKRRFICSGGSRGSGLSSSFRSNGRRQRSTGSIWRTNLRTLTRKPRRRGNRSLRWRAPSSHASPRSPR